MFYQRDDMMALYDAINNYVTKYVNLYYGKDINSQQLLIPIQKLYTEHWPVV